MWWLVGHGLRAAVRWRGFAKYSELRRGRRVRDPRGLSTGRTLLVLAGRAPCPRLGSWQAGSKGWLAHARLLAAPRPRHQAWVRAQAGSLCGGGMCVERVRRRWRYRAQAGCAVWGTQSPGSNNHRSGPEVDPKWTH